MIKVKSINLGNLLNLLKSVSSIDSSVYLNIDKNKVWSGVYTPAKDVVKYIKYDIQDIFDVDDIKTPIRLAFYSGKKLEQSLSSFNKDTIQAEIHTIEDGEYLYGEHLVLFDDKLKIVIRCQDPSLGFTSLNDNQIDVVFNKLESTNSIYYFNLTDSNLSKATSLGRLDDSEQISFFANVDGVSIKNDTFSMIVDDTKNLVTKRSRDSTFYKKHLDKLDKVDFDINVFDSKLIFTSVDKNIQVAIQLLVTD